jgi:hypothetical protein
VDAQRQKSSVPQCSCGPCSLAAAPCRSRTQSPFQQEYEDQNKQDNLSGRTGGDDNTIGRRRNTETKNGSIATTTGNDLLGQVGSQTLNRRSQKAHLAGEREKHDRQRDEDALTAACNREGNEQTGSARTALAKSRTTGFGSMPIAAERFDVLTARLEVKQTAGDKGKIDLAA